MFPKIRSELGFLVFLCVQKILHYLLVKETALWDSIHSLPDLNVDVSIFGDFVGEIVFIEKISREVAGSEAHVFVVGYRGVELEIFDVDSNELGSRVGDNTVEEELHH